MAGRKPEQLPIRVQARNRALLFVCVLALSLISCPPAQPCDEQVVDKEVLRDAALSHPETEKLSTFVSIRDVSVSDCYVDGVASIFVTIEVPPEYSTYGFRYSDHLSLRYSREGALSLGPSANPGTSSLESDEVMRLVSSMIADAESNLRVTEFLEKLGTSILSEPIRLDQGVARYEVEHGWIVYRLFANRVDEYSVPNSIHWREFPEIDQAHAIIEEKLLVGANSRCVISRGDLHSYTLLSFHYAEHEPLNLTVALDCDGEWLQAFVKLRPDGTYERLEFER